MQEKQLLELTGTVEEIVFSNENNGYKILELKAGEELITVVGTLPWVGCGEELRVIGTWIHHPSFGQQFKAEAFERSAPKTADAILRYLSSGAIKGIGPATATRLVEAFGEHTLEVMEQEPERLSTIKGLTRAKAEKIAQEFQRIYGIREIMLYLGGFGITPEEALRVWKQYGPSSKELIRTDPFLLCADGVDIDFGRADLIAESASVEQDDFSRLRAGLHYVLRHNTNNGHTCLPKDKLIPAAARMLGVEPETLSSVLEELKEERALIPQLLGGREFIFLPRYYQSESYCAGRLLMLLRYPAQSLRNVGGYIAAVEKRLGIAYAEGQKLAVRQALEQGMLILTGGPGTGKTTALNAIISILEEQGEKVLLAAPTGRAAKRMSEVTGKEAKTIHRMLQVEWNDRDAPTFARNEKNLLDCDALVLDELSMVDVQLFESVLHALPLGCRLILVGDCDQLPSVGAGNVLGDLIRCGKFPVVQLQEVFRQSMNSLIVRNAHRVVAGEMPELHDRTGDFFFLPMRQADRIADTVVGLYTERLPRTYGYDPAADIQVLCPGKRGAVGTEEMNRRLQEALNPPGPQKREINVNGAVLRTGDKVMQVRNDYNLTWQRPDGSTGEGVYNGDVGILLEIDKRGGTLTVQMDDRYVLYPLESAAELDLAYAMTVHKSQGNEFQAVVIPLYTGPSQLNYRNLLYTAITRAKSLLILVGMEQVIEAMVNNNRKTLRYSGLGWFLSEESVHEM
ncbi:SF1B family DNA helicase RecD2 [Faecalispora sporosphaeroides]|uniref:SF1B family DNA helicase RecD2 n=1 Tax=Faecalispora sporosphaeroides TaxID=1549 RepID=UPI000379282E|nr:ATP-dependent RecD-like DNA helicase [Faecalispora sporosphaeroides]